MTNISSRIKTLAVAGVGSATLLLTPVAVSAHADNSGHYTQRHDNKPATVNWATWQKKTPKPAPDCSARQTALNQKVANYKAAATKQLGYLNNFNAMIAGYVSANGLTVSNYAAPQAKVNADQATSTTDVNAIAAPTINCNSNDQALYNGSVKTAVSALWTYKEDLSGLLMAVLSA